MKFYRRKYMLTEKYHNDGTGVQNETDPKSEDLKSSKGTAEGLEVIFVTLTQVILVSGQHLIRDI